MTVQTNDHAGSNRAFSHDVIAAILVFQNNETAAMLVFQTNPVGVGLCSYAGGVRHEIRPIRMCYLWSDFRAGEEPFSEVYMVKFSIYSKLVWVISTQGYTAVVVGCWNTLP